MEAGSGSLTGSLTRRKFLIRAGSAAAVLGTGELIVLAKSGKPIPIAHPHGGLNPSVTLSFVRREDMVVLDLLGFNLKVHGTPHGPVLRRILHKRPGILLVSLQPQSIGEQAYDSMSLNVPAPGSVVTRLAGPSRLVFELPPGVNEVPFTAEGLLTFTELVPRLVPLAASTGKGPAVATLGIVSDRGPRRAIGPVVKHPAVRAPTPLETAIEAPWALLISPDEHGRWFNATKPVTRNGRTELWRTRLGALSGTTPLETPDVKPSISAIWTPGFPKHPLANPVKKYWSVRATDRVDLVHNTVDFSLGGDLPSPAVAEYLSLSALGATMDVHGVWNRACTGVEAWRTKLSLGRETYVRVVHKGFLYPFGVRASEITITERRFDARAGGWEAVLRQRKFIVVRQPVKQFGTENNPLERSGGRKFPWRRIELRTLVTPDIDLSPDPTRLLGGGLGYVVTVKNVELQWSLVGFDWEDHPSHFTMPLVFVESHSECAPGRKGSTKPVPGPAFDPGKMALINSDYMKPTLEAVRTVQLVGQKLAMAPAKKPGSTTVQTVSVVFGADTPQPALTKAALGAVDQCAFFPTLEKIAAHPPGLDALRGAMPGVGPTQFKFPQSFLDHGFPSAQDIANDVGGALKSQALGVFAEAIGAGPGFSLPGSGSGGMAIPGLDVGGLSRELGTVGNSVSDLLGGNGAKNWFDPSKYFNLDAKLLGVISLKDILSALGLDLTGAAGDANAVQSKIDELKSGIPKLPVEVIYPGNDKTKLPQAVKVTLHYETPVKVSDGEFAGFFEPNQKGMTTKLVLNAVIVTPLADPSQSTYDVLGSLNDFNVNLFGSSKDLQFFILEFKGIKFTSSSKAKPHLDVQLSNVAFGEALQFVAKLAELLKSETGGLSIDVSPLQVSATVSLGLPTLTVGVLSLQNIAIGFGFTLPFETGKVRVRANFCTREHPFILTVYIFGGGGFFGLALGLDGVELIEASFEFGAAAALDIGVASGSVHIMAGIYFKLSHDASKNSDVVELTGFVRAGGELKILGIITLSLEFYLSLSYVSPPGKAIGEAKMTVKVEILFFSASVELKVRKQFGSSDADPRMADMLTQGDYNTYCAAFS